MEERAFGRTGLRLPVLGFGCGAVGGLMVRGTQADQECTVAHALDAGIRYFDTAAMYGDGQSEINLGRVLRTLKPADAIIGTKVRLAAGANAGIRAAITNSVDQSLRRLGRDSVDILHLHNTIEESAPGALSRAQVLDEVVPALDDLRRAGKTRFIGFTAVGNTAALKAMLGSGAFASAQIVFNLLNPSAGEAIPADYPAQDYGGLLDDAERAGTGTIAIRVVAGGALSGAAARHPIASPPPRPIGSADSYDADRARAQRLMPLVERGYADTLSEAAIRFALSNGKINIILVGVASPDEFSHALAAIEKGALPADALTLAAELRAGFRGEPR